MKELRHLSLLEANFSGRIPHSLGNLTNLQHLDVSLNVLYADDVNWVSQLSSLQHLDMSGVYLGKALNLFHVLGKLPSLQEVWLMNCCLNKLHRPRQLVSTTNLSRVQVLYLTYNELETPILDAFQNMTSIRELDLAYNDFSSVPSWISKFKKLEGLGLANNMLHSPFPDALRNMTQMKILDLSQNNLVVAPSWLAELKSLAYLYLAGNKLSSQISVLPFLRKLCHLKILDLSRNKIQGEAFAGNLSNLRTLLLRQNHLNGTIPNSFGQLENLSYLDLSYNKLVGVFP
ncbi:hypothetical protein L6164_016532 [Bauhinia variegata]|uniref:Uncharacterized protein n=1 Tax=Bauhinia variegata TaxID=167791 RepID=A0ACB9NNQ0_BAUVA|nr:hypothetical protein L6164_016532 [Bauhinia variegata]